MATDAPVSIRSSTLYYLPVSLFGSIMGLTGLSLAWRLAQAHFGVPTWIAQAIGVVAVAAFVTMLLAYAIKAIFAFEDVKAEFAHPVTGAMFGTALISALLLPAVLAEMSLALARGLWIVGVIGMTVFAWHMAGRWLGIRQQHAHATPAWIVPLVGMLDIPLAVPMLGFAEPPHGVMMLGLAVGLFFAVPLFTIIFSRLMFEERIAPSMAPALLILMAPFSVGFSAYVITTGQIDLFAQGLYVLSLFMLVVLVTQLRSLRNCCPFKVSWWAVSFPLAATAGAAIRYAAYAHALWTDAFAAILLALATAIVGGLLIRTLGGIARGELRHLSS